MYYCLTRTESKSLALLFILEKKLQEKSVNCKLEKNVILVISHSLF